MQSAIKAILFDVYGTLLDVYAIAREADAIFPGKGTALSELWRDKQIEYTRLRTLSERYVPFWQVTQDALAFACARLGLELTQTARETLLARYVALAPHPETLRAVAALARHGLPLGVLSNGDPEMLRKALGAAGLLTYLPHVLSVDSVRKFKTAPETYELGPRHLGLPAREILFVSSNAWDAAGATWFGYTTFWINRGNVPFEHLGVAPSFQGTSLNDVCAHVGCDV